MKISSAYRFIFYANQTYFHEIGCARTRFETEAQGNLEIACSFYLYQLNVFRFLVNVFTFLVTFLTGGI